MYIYTIGLILKTLAVGNPGNECRYESILTFRSLTAVTAQTGTTIRSIGYFYNKPFTLFFPSFLLKKHDMQNQINTTPTIDKNSLRSAQYGKKKSFMSMLSLLLLNFFFETSCCF